MNYTKVNTSKTRNNINGAIGEINAAAFLKNKKMKILQTNFKTKFGEIDIVALDKKTIVFIEVKRRSTLAFGRPIEAIDFRKQAKIKKVAEFYLAINKKTEADVRFDVVEIVDNEVNYIENAF